MMTIKKGKIATHKVHGEANHPDTCTTLGTLTQSKCVIANGTKTLALHPVNEKGILITDAYGNATFRAVPAGEAGYNKLLSVNTNKQLVWIDQ